MTQLKRFTFTQVLLAAAKDLVNETDIEGRTLLHMCVAEASTNVLAAALKCVLCNTCVYKT